MATDITFITIHSASDEQVAPILKEMICELERLLDQSCNRLVAGSLGMIQAELDAVIQRLRRMRGEFFKAPKPLLFNLRQARKYLSAAAEKIDSTSKGTVFFDELAQARKHLEEAQRYF